MLAIGRVIFILCYFTLASLAMIVMCLVRPFHRNNVHVIGKVYGAIAPMIGLKVKVNVPTSVKNGGPFVFVANHQNSYDLITVCLSAQKGVVSVGKKSLVLIPIFGWLYWLSGNILIDRKDSGRAKDTLKQTIDKINQRKLSVFFFPEGTRSRGRGLLSFKTGAFRIAQAVNEPIVMVSTSNLHQKIQLNRWDNGTLLIDLSEPVILDKQHDAKTWAKEIHNRMKIKIAELDNQVAQIDEVK
ncbi:MULTISPECIES: 1-acylglycerol-3-phosphate O-acyltransferase [Alteromonadaceae]|uniref:1-acylglycerol-3-phosphate O-acyltransferase n=1 Tax=Alteromonadaceae TaxID=72275 RepID=UPI001C094C6E|nr:MULTISPECIES: 1-acylglycerol-3-phosphate O-acyltransferase [unclassified Aliiglaciecola]MBU2878488.1 1-acylglycerol-3-phosphate O-acyltransferase [Aliiglaciecola lipolytica]MDO6709696.1 1-acylglycerol-3-phosphate O-acyltransferase [Aliiglaciecola sp. 2_MG-2023]MDO6750762.1 1-acylglycerol-3-phosphate O-acyltransferase [Aliiglaciecola sp. 1_MG-2023]